MKKTMILALVLILALSLAACGGNNPPASSSPASNPPSGGGNETASQTDTSKSTAKWVLVSTETKLNSETNDDLEFSGENGEFEALVKTADKSGSVSAAIMQPPTEINNGDRIPIQISGNCSNDYPSDWECSAFIRVSGYGFSISDNSTYEHYNVAFGTGGGKETSNSETKEIVAKDGLTLKTSTITLGLYAYNNNISTTYTYEWQTGN